jgi:hypothetical protein
MTTEEVSTRVYFDPVAAVAAVGREPPRPAGVTCQYSGYFDRREVTLHRWCFRDDHLVDHTAFTVATPA